MSTGQRSDGEGTDLKQSAAMTPKSVTIANPEGHTSYFDLGEPAISTTTNNPKQHKASGAKRLSGRSSKASLERLPKLSSLSLSELARDSDSGASTSTDHAHVHAHTRLHGAVATWLKDERAKWNNRTQPHEKSYAQLAFEGLEKILSEHTIVKHQRPVFHGPKRVSSHKKLRRPSLLVQPSDTEFSGDAPVVPTTDEVLDNSKTVSTNETKDDGDWLEFKNEIIKLAHTLRLKGWRRVELNSGNDIDVKRISGALTNAVYVVVPPKNLPTTPAVESQAGYVSKRSPVKLLLRIYGPQVGHLIDREKELEILKRLARKHIGPRLLGTFLNGRFEQFLNATPLVSKDLLDPEISQQIAKRMRELHDGIDLTREERSAGPFVWQNWDKWVRRCEEVTTWLDEQILKHEESSITKTEAWKTRGFVCGVQWTRFRAVVDAYRQHLKQKYGGGQALRDSLVFAHNDTHSGNILRIIPSGESPLLLPSNSHKQLAVIDFEYANANTPGFEFANHFTEWCYDYHADIPWKCNTDLYPTVEEQERFVRAYVQHQPRYHSAQTSSSSQSATSSGTGLASFILDSRAAPSSSAASQTSNKYSYAEEEKAREADTQKQIQHWIEEARLWRVANSAQWVAWGIVQAKVAGMEEALAKTRAENGQDEEVPVGEAEGGKVVEQKKDDTEDLPQVPHEHDIDDEGGFDYLAFAQDRALFFWGDLLEMGIVQESDLPEQTLKMAKRVKY